MEAHEKATQRRIQGIHEAVTEGLECPQRARIGEDTFYCRSHALAEQAACPYICEETVPVCIDMPSQEREDYILKRTKVKPTGPSESVPSHMEEKHICEYTILE